MSFKSIITNTNILSLSKYDLFIYSLWLLPVGLLFGESPTSVSEIIVIGLWIFTNQWREKLRQVKNNPHFWSMILLYIIHIIGLIYTSDFQYALKDLRIKLPLIIFPLIIFSSSITHKQIIYLLKWYVLVVFINLLYLWLHTLIHYGLFIDARDISIFISHIRLGLISAFAMICAVYIFINYSDEDNVLFFKTAYLEKVLFLLVAILILILIVALGLMTGIVAVGVTTLFAIVYMLIKNRDKYYFKWILALSMLLGCIAGYYIYVVYHKYFPQGVSYSITRTHTLSGNVYQHQFDLNYTENGYPVMQYICDKELKKEWEKRSNIPFDGKDKKGNDLKYTLYRYLASKGLTKDSVGMTQMTDEDIYYVECSYPNYQYARAGYLERRIYEIIQEYKYFKTNKNPNGKTITLRLYYWKIGIDIFLKNLWWGVGTGDVNWAYQNEYTHYVDIQKAHQLRAHNQIITMALTFGILGLIIILWNIVFPLLHLLHSNDYVLYYLYSVIVIVSFCIDDMLETQPGVTFYAMMNTLLIQLCLSYSKTKTYQL